MNSIYKAIGEINRSFWGKWLVLALVIGILSGLAAVVFQFLTETVQHFSLALVAGYEPLDALGEHAYFDPVERGLRAWMILPVIAVGGLVTGLLVFTLAPDARGHGTDGAIDAFHNKRGTISWRIPIVKTIASAITLGTGGSAGREGPIAQIGAGFGSFLAHRWQLSAHDRRIMLAMGMGAGIGAIFRAPLAGAIFAGEIMYRDADIEAEVIIPGAIASTVAYAVFQLSLPVESRFTPLFGELIHHEFSHISELIPYTALAFALSVAAAFYVTVFHQTERIFKAIPVMSHVKPMMGAILTGLLAIGVHQSMGGDLRVLACLSSGYGFLQQAIDNVGSLTVQILLVVALLKILTTSLTIGSGGSGGVFGPSMVIGGSVGAAVGKLFHQAMPGIVTQPGAYAIVGMAGFFAGCANAPFSTILMVSEMTGDYKLLVPTVWVGLLCFILCRRWSLYSSQVSTRLESPAHKGDFTIDLLEGILVREAFKPKKKLMTFREDATLDEIVHSLTKTAQRYFPVLDANGKLVGIFSTDDVRCSLYDEVLWKVAIARDVMTEDVVTVAPDDDLNTALSRFTALNVDELPVVDKQDSNVILGVLRRKEAIAAYTRRRLEMQHQRELETKSGSFAS